MHFPNLRGGASSILDIRNGSYEYPLRYCEPSYEGNLDQSTNLPVYTQDIVPVDLVKTMVAHVFWGSKDTNHLSQYGIKCLALKTCTCLFCNRGALDNRITGMITKQSCFLEWCSREPIAGLALLICYIISYLGMESWDLQVCDRASTITHVDRERKNSAY